MSVTATGLLTGGRYRVTCAGRRAAVPVMPLHTDEAARAIRKGEGAPSRMFSLRVPVSFTVATVRPATHGLKKPWYAILTVGGQTGWVNSIALEGLTITRV